MANNNKIIFKLLLFRFSLSISLTRVFYCARSWQGKHNRYTERKKNVSANSRYSTRISLEQETRCANFPYKRALMSFRGFEGLRIKIVCLSAKRLSKMMLMNYEAKMLSIRRRSGWDGMADEVWWVLNELNMKIFDVDSKYKNWNNKKWFENSKPKIIIYFLNQGLNPSNKRFSFITSISLKFPNLQKKLT